MLRLGISSFFFHTIRIKAEVPLFDLIEQPKVISEWTNDNDFDGSIILYSVEQLFLPFFWGFADVIIRMSWLNSFGLTTFHFAPLCPFLLNSRI